jgi:aspartate racemase
MEEDFYVDRLRGHGLDVVVPGADDRRLVDTVIYDELCRGVVREQSRREYERVVAALVDDGCEAVVLGCTEIELLLDPSARPAGARLFPTTRLHCEAAVDRALAP